MNVLFSKRLKRAIDDIYHVDMLIFIVLAYYKL